MGTGEVGILTRLRAIGGGLLGRDAVILDATPERLAPHCGQARNDSL